MANEILLRGNVGGVIDLRVPEDSMDSATYYRLCKQNELWHKRSTAAVKGWETRRKNSRKNKKTK